MLRSSPAATESVAVVHKSGHARADRTPLHLRALIPIVRTRLGLGDDNTSDAEILACLAAIAARADTRARWLAAFNSAIGQALALRGSDLNTNLSVLITLVPRART